MKMKMKRVKLTSCLLKLESNRPNVNFLAMLERFAISVCLDGQFTIAPSRRIHVEVFMDKRRRMTPIPSCLL